MRVLEHNDGLSSHFAYNFAGAVFDEVVVGGVVQRHFAKVAGKENINKEELKITIAL